MSKKSPNSFLFPEMLEREYRMLMNSKLTFLENLFPADEIALKRLYDNLEKLYAPNIIRELNEALRKSYLALRVVEKKREAKSKEFSQQSENNMILLEKQEQTLKNRVVENTPILEQKQKRIFRVNMQMNKIALRQEEKKLQDSKTIWKQDIIEKESSLKDEEKNFKRSKESFPEQSILRQKQKLLLERLLKLQNYQSTLADQLNLKSKEFRYSCEKQSKIMKLTLKEASTNFENSMQRKKNKLMNSSLEKEMKKSKTLSFFENKSLSMISSKLNQKKKDCDHLSGLLEKELIKRNLTLDDLLIS